MKLILNNDVDNLGRVGDLVSVRDGYARNFLLPRGLAVMANERNKAALESHMKRLEKTRAASLAAAKAIATQIEKTSVTIAKQVGEDEKIFGTVTTSELEELLVAEGLKISKKDIVINEDIKKIGLYSAQVKVHPDVSAKFKIWVVAQ